MILFPKEIHWTWWNDEFDVLAHEQKHLIGHLSVKLAASSWDLFICVRITMLSRFAAWLSRERSSDFFDRIADFLPIENYHVFLRNFCAAKTFWLKNEYRQWTIHGIFVTLTLPGYYRAWNVGVVSHVARPYMSHSSGFVFFEFSQSFHIRFLLL